jgi:hypothetical protein
MKLHDYIKTMGEGESDDTDGELNLDDFIPKDPNP